MENRPPVDEVLDPPEEPVLNLSIPGRLRARFLRQSRGAAILNFALGVVTGYAVAALLGIVTPVTAAVVGLGAQVIGTVAFFLTYYVGRRE